MPVTDQAAALRLWCWWTGCTTGTCRSCPAGCRWTGFPDELLVGGDGKKDLRATSRIRALARQAGETGADCVTGEEGNGLMRLSSQEVA